jgi:hypothetical protein
MRDVYAENGRFSFSNVHKIHKRRVFLFLNHMTPIDMFLISCMNRPSFSFEIDLKSRRHKARCELKMNDTAIESFEIVTRVQYY